jgi:alkylmercury lyase
MIVRKNFATGAEAPAQDGAANAVGGTFAQRLAAASAAPPKTQHLSVTLFQLLGEGRPVSCEVLARACGLTLSRTMEMLDQWPAAVERDAGGAIIGFSGLSLEPTRHRFVTAEAELHTWCAFDALFLPEILGKPAVLITHCPASAAELTVELAPGKVRSARPADAVLSIVVPNEKAYKDNLRSAFCCHVNLFRDAPTFDAWARGRDGIGRVSLEEAQRLAQRRNALRYPDVKIGA